jgi:protein-S-isoprenylcysteine O-methyltransferase Ste14
VENARQAPVIAKLLKRGVGYLTEDFLGGPRHVMMSWVISAQKGSTLFYVALLMWWFHNGSTTAWVYLALHGSYGFCWVLKHFAFRDASWERRVTWGAVLLMTALSFVTYWLFPYLLLSNPHQPRLPDALLAFAIFIHTLGVVTMMSADAQKYFTLKYRKGLIEEGMFKHVRHSNYAGEIALYCAYAILVQHWLPWVILGLIWSLVFLPNMVMKEASISRHPGWAEYKKRTGMLLPWL